jgi:type II secretory pathway pseudopilin PulG
MWTVIALGLTRRLPPARSTADSKEAPVLAKLVATVRERLDGGTDSDSGFTVLEVLVAFTLFVLAASTATFALYTSINASHVSQQRGTAAGIAQSYIAQAAANTTTIGVETNKPYSATVGSEQFTVLRSIVFSLAGETQCTRGSYVTVNVVVNQAQTSKFLARSDTRIAC